MLPGAPPGAAPLGGNGGIPMQERCEQLRHGSNDMQNVPAGGKGGIPEDGDAMPGGGKGGAPGGIIPGGNGGRPAEVDRIRQQW